MSRNLLIVVASLAVATSAAAAGADVQRLPVEDFRELLVRALDAADGASHGVLVGPMADAITSRMKAPAPILIDVTTLKRYQQPGCGRLNVRFSQGGVVLPGATKPRNETFDLGLNFCRDGLPPKSLT